jgi:hypothetical protein
MSRPLSSHEEIQCHGPRFQSAGKTGYHPERSCLSVVVPCFGCQNEGGNLMPKVTFSVRRTSTRKDQCGPSFGGLPGFTLRQLCRLAVTTSRTACPSNSSEG